MSNPLDCTIVILSYNSLDVTDTCLTKLETSIKYCEAKLKNKFTVIVVDNASKDGSAKMIAKKHPTVQLKALKENIGYAAGNNVAMKAAKTPYILLMNSDTYIHEDSLYKTFTKMVERTECDVLVSRCIWANGVLQEYGGYLPTPSRIITWAFGLESVPVIKNFLPRIYGFNPDYYNHEGIMEWCPPCFFLLKREVFDATQGFDEKLWFHMVDAEWCHRIHQNGFVIGFTPTVEVLHLGGASSKGIQYKLISDNFKGLAHFCRKHYPESTGSVFSFVRNGLKVRSLLFSILGRKEMAETYKNIATEMK